MAHLHISFVCTKYFFFYLSIFHPLEVKKIKFSRLPAKKNCFFLGGHWCFNSFFLLFSSSQFDTLTLATNNEIDMRNDEWICEWNEASECIWMRRINEDVLNQTVWLMDHHNEIYVKESARKLLLILCNLRI